MSVHLNDHQNNYHEKLFFILRLYLWPLLSLRQNGNSAWCWHRAGYRSGTLGANSGILYDSGDLESALLYKDMQQTVLGFFAALFSAWKLSRPNTGTRCDYFGS